MCIRDSHSTVIAGEDGGELSENAHLIDFSLVFVICADRQRVGAGCRRTAHFEAILCIGAVSYTHLDVYKRQADIAARILKGEAKPNDTPIEYPEDIQIALNMSAAERMGAEIPEDLIDDAYEVIR